ncbi:MAG: adenine phosphoribosyltransferase [bacterium]
MTLLNLKEFIREIPDFPKKGINFKDITPLLADREAFTFAIDSLVDGYIGKNIDYVVCIEARGFVVGAPLAYRLGAGVIMVRKPGKLPYECSSLSYDLEYGSATLEIHKDALKKGDRVIIADDVLATGGTAIATISLVEGFGAEVADAVFLAELSFLNGRDRLKPHSINSLLKFDY